jgi:hypothetical protein
MNAITLETTQCPMCEGFSCGGHREGLNGPTAYGGWVWRMDLLAFVCPKCNRDLGPDEARALAMLYCTDPTIYDNYMAGWG